MKTIGLLWLGAALALAADQDPAKKATEPKTAIARPPSRMARPAGPAAQPKRNVHHPAVAIAPPQLTPQQKASAAMPGLPQGAEEVGPNLFRYTDPQGKKWMYRNTPFGYSKWEEKPDERKGAAETLSSAGLTMTDLGDSVQFQRMTPFGAQKWTRKKSELTDEEKAALATQQHAREAVSGSQPADAAKVSGKQPEKQ